MRYLCITIRFFDPYYEGFKDKKFTEVDWPPAPLRCFQALIRGVKDWERAEGTIGVSDTALRWLEALPAPTIIVPLVSVGKAYGTFVPINNVDENGHPIRSSIKIHRPVYLPDDAFIEYIWPLPEGDIPAPLLDMPRHMVNLGRGTVLVTADATVLDEMPKPDKERIVWSPDGDHTDENYIRCQVPIKGTYDDTERHFQRSLEYIQTGVEPVRITTYDSVGYRHHNSRKKLPVNMFEILWEPNTVLKNVTIETAGMMRHTTAQALREQMLDEAWIRKHVLGHFDDPVEAKKQQRLAFLPLPSYQKWSGGSRIGGIKRILVTSFNPDFRPETEWVAECLKNQNLVQENGKIAAQLVSVPDSTPDFVRDRYIGTSTVWETCTAMLLSGHDDPGGCRKALKEGRRVTESSAKMITRINHLVRKGFLQAGFPEALLEGTIVEWQKEGLLPGVPHCRDFTVSRHHTHCPRYHVRVTFPQPVTGPVCVGDGRFYGMGLFLIPAN
ncbi:MAG: type I-U CRISPR-associated protein Csb2 [Candidatus Paceibacterota bacterium]